MAGQDPKKDFESLSPVLELIYGLVKNMDSYLQVYAEDIKVDYLKEYKEAKAALENLVQVLERIFGLDMHAAQQVANAAVSQVKQSIEETTQGKSEPTIPSEGMNGPSAASTSTTEPPKATPQDTGVNTPAPLEPAATEHTQAQSQAELPPLEQKVDTRQTPEASQGLSGTSQPMSTPSAPQTPASTLEPTPQVEQQVPMGQPSGGAMPQTGQPTVQPTQPGTPANMQAQPPATGQPAAQPTPTSAQPAANQPQAAPTGNPDDDPELKAILDELKNIQGQQK